jgi:hypothetical protein
VLEDGAFDELLEDDEDMEELETFETADEELSATFFDV